MALNEANQPIRSWKERINTWLSLATAFVSEITKAFLNIKEGDGLVTKSVKTADLVARRTAYFFVDYGLVLVSIVIVASMKALGYSFFEAFMALWAFDFVAAGAFVVFYEATGKDLSLGEDFRRVTDVLHTKSKIAGYLSAVPVILLAIAWTGPEQVVIYFRKELNTIIKVTSALLLFTAMQAVIWTIVYGFAYDLVAMWLSS